MFTLRIIEETRRGENAPFEQVIENHELGSSYAKLKQGITSEFELEIEHLSERMKEDWPDLNIKTDIDCIICAANGEMFFIMNEKPDKKFSYFIMTENGKTFEKL